MTAAPVTSRETPSHVTRSGRWWLLPLVIYSASRLVEALLIALAARDQLPRDPAMAMVSIGTEEDPGYLDAVTGWDGQWYREIALHGYPRDLPQVDGVVQQSPWAFFPGYPALVRLVMVLTRLPFEVAATVVSLAAGAVAVVLLHRLVERSSTRFSATATVTALCVFPAAPVLQAAYTESLALLVLLVCLTLLQAQRFGWLSLAVTVLAFTRPVVLPLAAVIALHGFLAWRRRNDEPVPRRVWWGYAATSVYAALSFAFWPTVAGFATGEPDAYLLTQRAWSPDREWVSWLGHLLEPGHRAPAFLAVLVLAIVTLLALRGGPHGGSRELRLWAPLYLLYVLATARPTTSIFRYAILAVLPVGPAAGPPAEPCRRVRVSVLVALVVVGLPLQYLWLRWYFVVHPGSISHP